MTTYTEPRDLWDKLQLFNITVLGVPEKEESEKQLEMIMAEKYLNFVKTKPTDPGRSVKQKE